MEKLQNHQKMHQNTLRESIKQPRKQQHTQTNKYTA